ncbi:MAG: GGDEF domain-containing protein [Ketobacter sp.]|nr:GGDEF domain-containing protein [Ketobacter sp.]
MPENNTQNWKDKYLTALEEFELCQKKDSQRLDLLRRGLVRVSLAADGLDPALDEQLDEIRTGLRGGRDIQTLEPVIAQLERTIVALDDRRKDEHGELRNLIDTQLEQYLAMSLPRADKSTIKKLRKSLPQLLSGSGNLADIIKSLNQANGQVIRHLSQRIEELGEGKSGLLSRLFGNAGNDKIDSDKIGSDSTDDDNNDDDNDSIVIDNPDFENPAISASDQEEYGIDPKDSDEASDSAPPPPTSDMPLAQHDPELLQRLGHILCGLLEQLEVPPDYSSRKEQLVDRIKAPFPLDHLPEFLDETTQLVASTRMVAQKEFEGFLVALHQRLNDIQEFLVTARQGEERSLQNQEKLDQDVRQELADMKVTVEGSNDLGKLKLDIESMVNRIVAAVDLFHSEEKQRRDAVFEHIEALGQRMASMEGEALELKNNLETQRLEALRDALTELPNRAAYDDQIDSEFTRWRRHSRPLSIAIIDIDHFKQVNDTLGHLRGDKVLKLVAREVSRRIRNEDFVARYGGEEFVAIMPETDLESAYAAMEKVRLAIEECPFNFNQQRIPITASFGIATFHEGDEIETCFERADKALYKAKENGRNRIERG